MDKPYQVIGLQTLGSSWCSSHPSHSCQPLAAAANPPQALPWPSLSPCSWGGMG